MRLYAPSCKGEYLTHKGTHFLQHKHEATNILTNIIVWSIGCWRVLSTHSWWVLFISWDYAIETALKVKLTVEMNRAHFINSLRQGYGLLHVSVQSVLPVATV